MSEDSTISLILGIPIGLISGIYTGIIVSRLVRFAELRNETLRIIRGINFIERPPVIEVSNENETSKLILISGDMYFLKHSKAGDILHSLSIEISRTNYEAKAGKTTLTEYSKHYEEWQIKARNLSPNKWVIFRLWGSI